MAATTSSAPPLREKRSAICSASVPRLPARRPSTWMVKQLSAAVMLEAVAVSGLRPNGATSEGNLVGCKQQRARDGDLRLRVLRLAVLCAAVCRFAQRGVPLARRERSPRAGCEQRFFCEQAPKSQSPAGAENNSALPGAGTLERGLVAESAAFVAWPAALRRPCPEGRCWRSGQAALQRRSWWQDPAGHLLSWCLPSPCSRPWTLPWRWTLRCDSSLGRCHRPPCSPRWTGWTRR